LDFTAESTLLILSKIFEMKNRRIFLKSVALASAGLAVSSPSNVFGAIGDEAPFTLPNLLFATDALEPFIDKMTMEIHHGKHHKAYIDNLNKAVLTNDLAKGKTLDQLFGITGQLPPLIRNNAGGHFNHSLFWTLLSPAIGQVPGPKFSELIAKSYGSFDKFKEEFAKTAMQRFGSGWAWAVLADGKLSICSTPNQDNPLMDVADTKGFPVLALDVWEHAYYLKYQNLRADYVKSFWNIINWETVEARIIEHQKAKH